MKNFYEILEVAPDATMAQIKKSYRHLSKKYHPDLAPGNQAAVEKFKEIAAAYNTLSNAESRKAYDEKLFSAQPKPKRPEPEQENWGTQVNFDFNNVQQHFENFFGFDPVTKEKKARFTQGAADKNPLDTSDAFESFFKVKRKKK
ncbi:MAG: DnaJ domain-containing protein [Sporomusaceae bacterium]|jgi:molecular chaperone DnaJ|nr:DnaJ domain-containing protein [Sporomusaceae bacterium]